VHVYETASAGQSDASGGASLAIASEPIIIHLPEVEITEPFIEIIDAGSGGRVVTTIEFVSRSNKRAGPGRKDYLRKRSETIRAGANVVEVDLLRGGRPVTLASPDLIPPKYRAAYHASVYRAAKPER